MCPCVCHLLTTKTLLGLLAAPRNFRGLFEGQDMIIRVRLDGFWSGLGGTGLAGMSGSR